ncbi:hypothetical protein [Microvirga lenta]|uniref:hypothetical protein n=1 Tax=Microvirga lenta TaxID=2881337 RepID=UPI001CFFB48B|nr:hypothetical protein [Microvirga lenta]MCB5176050.1 hypothetical protein [Microvirga lenta]
MIRRSLPSALVFGALVAFASSPVSAQTSCGPRDQLVKVLSEQYKESPVSIGLAQPGRVVEVFASSSGTWSMVMTMPNGTACMIAAGENWEMLSRVKGTGI